MSSTQCPWELIHTNLGYPRRTFMKKELPLRQSSGGNDSIAVPHTAVDEDEKNPRGVAPAKFPESHYGKITTTRDNNHEPRVGNQPHAPHPESGTPQRKPVPRVQVEDAKPRDKKLREVTRSNKVKTREANAKEFRATPLLPGPERRSRQD